MERVLSHDIKNLEIKSIDASKLGLKDRNTVKFLKLLHIISSL
jgi:hypothetical protein